MTYKIVLIQVWLGKIPDYFWHHYETTKNLKNIDFLFFTDQDLTLDSKKYKIIKITKENLENLINSLLKGKVSSNITKYSEIKLLNNKKTCDLKASYGDIFQNIIKEYDYYGFYDLDTLFGDVNSYLQQYLGEYDIITTADEIYHNRIGGPFTIFKNIKELRTEYITDEFFECFKNPEVESYEEGAFFMKIGDKYKIKYIYSNNCEIKNGGKNTFEAVWSGGKLYVNDEEKFIYHFLKKNNTQILRAGNTIFAQHKKYYQDDFYWVVYFTKNYEDLFNNLLNSFKMYSNRKCIIYSINYDYRLPLKETFNEQFILRRIDIEEGEKDIRGRDNNILCYKPLINLDVISAFPNTKFVSIDTDIYLTVNSDNIRKYFDQLENYPLINMHVHDVIYVNNIYPDEEWTSSLHILLNEMGIESNPETDNYVRPRRKTNVLIFDDKSEWFFKEQLDIIKNYKNKKPGILHLHDEDAANAILSKYNLTKSLPLLDIEESDDIDIEKFFKYTYSVSYLSPLLVLPKTKNDVLFFHGLKSQEHYDRIKKNYDIKVLQSDDFVIKYQNSTILFEKNSFLDSKKIQHTVDFIFKDFSGNIIINFPKQNIYQYFMFYITNVFLENGLYTLEIYENESQNKIYQNTIKIENGN